jgi:hypothetical protein
VNAEFVFGTAAAVYTVSALGDFHLEYDLSQANASPAAHPVVQ